MLTDADVQRMRRRKRGLGKFMGWIVLIFPVGLVLVANVNLFLSMNMTASAGVGVGELITAGIEGLNPTTMYQGVFVKAVMLFREAIMQGLAALIFAVIAFAYESSRKMNERIIDTLKERGALSTDTQIINREDIELD